MSEENRLFETSPLHTIQNIYIVDTYLSEDGRNKSL